MTVASDPVPPVGNDLSLSVVVVAYGMARELPRTLRSLASPYQRGIDPADYEVVVVDNGSPTPVDRGARGVLPGPIPAHPARPGAAVARSGGQRRHRGRRGRARRADRRRRPHGVTRVAGHGRSWPGGLAARPVIATAGWHLGPVRHMEAAEAGYDQAAEDELLGGIDWEADGYRLFEIATLAGSSGRGWFGPLSESSALFLPADLWTDLGGLDERFVDARRRPGQPRPLRPRLPLEPTAVW